MMPIVFCASFAAVAEAERRGRDQLQTAEGPVDRLAVADPVHDPASRTTISMKPSASPISGE